MHMKKLLAIFISSFLLLPALSNAALIVPFINITVNKFVEGEDNNFSFHIRGYRPILYFSQDFNIQTIGGQGTHFTSSSGVSNGDHYYITEDIPEGWQLEEVSCTSTDPNFNYALQADGVSMTVKRSEEHT